MDVLAGGFLPSTFLAGSAPGICRIVQDGGRLHVAEKKKWEGQCWIAVWPTQSDRVVELDTADQWTVELYRVSMAPHCPLDSANQKNEAEGPHSCHLPVGGTPGL